VNAVATLRRTRWWIIVGVVILDVVLFIPLYSGVLGSLTPGDHIGSPSLFPRYVHWQNFVEIWYKVPLAKYMLNSMLYAGLSCVIAVSAALPAGYAVSRFRFAGRHAFLFLILITQMVSVSMIIIPMFRSLITLNLFDSALAVIVTIAAMPIPLIVWLLKNYFDTIPVELEEAAAVDGCTRVGALLRILLPVAVPGVVTSLIIAFTTTYNQFFIPMVFLSSESKYPALVGVYTMAAELVPPWHLVMAASLVVLIPPLVVFFVCQRYVMSGLTAGAVKG
jgi:multiple sugar transport system permease protein